MLAALGVFVKSKWAVAICASDADGILAVVKKQRQDSPRESVSVHVLCPPR